MKFKKTILGIACVILSQSSFAQSQNGSIPMIPNQGNASGNVPMVPTIPNNMQNSEPVLPNSIPSDNSGNIPSGYEQTRGVPTEQNSNDPVARALTILNADVSKIRQINKDLYKKGKVLNESPTPAAKHANTVIAAHLHPGAISPVVRLAKGITSTIVLTDVTGKPWPLINFDGLSSEDFVIKRLDKPAPDGFILSITPMSTHASGNLILVLKELDSPISVDFITGQKEVDVKTEIRVQGKGPNAGGMSIGMPNGIDTQLLSVLQGVTPAGSKQLKTSSNAVQVWLAKDEKYMYVRTRYKIMSPAFENVTSSPDGTFAYKMTKVPVVLFKMAEGKFGEFTVDGF